MKNIHVFLRKKRIGENSMEMLMNQYKEYFPDLKVFELPYHSTNFKGIWGNIKFSIKHRGERNWIYSIGEGYLSMFLSKTLVTIHDIDSIKNLKSGSKIISYFINLYLPSLKPSIRYHCISNYTRNVFLKMIPFRKKNSFVSYNPIDREFLDDYPIKELNKNEITILQIGTGKRKNLESVIEAIKDNCNFKLVIVGILTDHQTELLKKYHINYKNYYDIPREDLIQLYQSSDIVTFPSNSEGFGMIIIEANALGKPVIAGDIPVLHEIGGNSVWYVEPGNPSQLNKAINLLTTNSELRNNLIQNGYKNIERFKMENVFKVISKEFI